MVSGSGNVAIYTHEKVTQLGATVVAMSDSNGVIVDEKGIDLATVKELKEVERRRIKDYCERHQHARYIPGGNIWDIPCDVAFPSATENEINGKDAKKLVKNGCIAVGEGANMPTTPEGVQVFLSRGHSLRAGQGGQRGRRGHLGTGDAAECRPGRVGIRGDRRRSCRAS